MSDSVVEVDDTGGVDEACLNTFGRLRGFAEGLSGLTLRASAGFGFTEREIPVEHENDLQG